MPMPNNETSEERLLDVVNALDEHERIRRNSDGPAELKEVHAQLKHAITRSVHDDAVDDGQKQRNES